MYILFFIKKPDTQIYLCNYAFKYINAKSFDEFVDYKIEESEEIEIAENSMKNIQMNK